MFQKLCSLAVVGAIAMTAPAWAQQPLFVAYPPNNHQTTAPQIFLIGTAAPEGEVFVNGQPIPRSPAGHFAPSFPLQLGENVFTLRHQNQELQIRVTRNSDLPPAPVGVAFADNSLQPSVDVARMPGDRVCFSAIAPPRATVSVQLANQTIPLSPQPLVTLPPNSAVLTGENQPTPVEANRYQGCTLTPNTATPLNLGQPQFRLSLNGQTITQTAPGSIQVLSPTPFEIAEVTAASGTARTGPGTDYSRLTPLPPGTQAAITGREGDWLRLDYGAWIRSSETRIINSAIPPRSLIRSVRAQQVPGWTEIRFPLQTPVPLSIDQGDRHLTLNLYNTTAQTDVIRLDDDPIIARLDWQQVSPDRIQYRFNLKSAQQWGYKVRYEGTTLVLSLRHPPTLSRNRRQPLSGMTILIDPGHGSDEDLGARGPTGYPEKDVTLIVSKLLRDRLIERGAQVVMTREGDDDLYPQDRVDVIEQTEPHLALSVHYNALPDQGDAINTAGVGMFWYHPQAHSLSVFLHNYLVNRLRRPSYGVFWNNLALTRPTVAPSVLLELGFMINPVEFEWIVNPQEQQRLATALADAVVEWRRTTQP